MMRIKALSVFLIAAALSTGIAIAHGDEEGTAHEHADGQPESVASATPAEESYALGAGFGRQMQSIEADIDTDAFVRGLKDALSGEDLAYTEDQLRSFSISFNNRITARRQQMMESQGSENRSAGLAFLADNQAREGVTVTDSGLQYEVLVPGDGPKPAAEDKVSVHYHGTLIDGSVFDSSRERGQPASFPLNRVIPGWTEGLQLMPVGSTFKFYIPSELAYGSRGAPPKIGPDSTLVFEVELLEILD